MWFDRRRLAGLPGATVIATLVAVVVTASFPLYCYGSWIVINAEDVTWGVLSRHLRYVGAGLLLTTVPLVIWMVLRFLDSFSGPVGVHAFFGLQAYVFLLVALTEIV